MVSGKGPKPRPPRNRTAYAALISPKEQEAMLVARDALLEREAEETGNVEPISGRS